MEADKGPRPTTSRIQGLCAEKMEDEMETILWKQANTVSSA